MLQQSQLLSLIWLLTLNFCFSLQCARRDSRADKAEPKNVFSHDDREQISYPTYPFSAIGRLDSGCTGTLISDQLVLTAAHCVVDNATGRLKPNVSYFRPSLSPGHVEQRAWIRDFWIGSYSPESNRQFDYAVLRLASPLRGYSFITISPQDLGGQLPDYVAFAGYSVDKLGGNVLSFHRTCRVRSKNAVGLVFHDCDATSGVSGGPLMQYNGSLQKYEIVGIGVSEYRRGAADSVYRDDYSQEYANVGIALSSFRPVVDQILKAGSQLSPAQVIDGAFYMYNSNQQAPDSGNALNGVPAFGSTCPGGTFFINADVLFNETEQLEQNACLQSSLAPYFIQLVLSSSHRTLYEYGRRLNTSSVLLCSILRDFKSGRVDYTFASQQLEPHLCSVLAETTHIRQYVSRHFSELRSMDATVDSQTRQAYESAELLGRLVLNQ